MQKIRKNLNKYTIAFLIMSITLFGALSFIFNKDTVDSLINYYIIFASAVGIIILFFNNIEEFKWKNLKKVPLILTIITIIWIGLTFFLGIKQGMESIKGFINMGCLLVLGYIITNIKLDNKEKNFIYNSIFISFAICMILGIWQYFSGVNLIQYSNALYPGILGRINSTFYIATILDKYTVLISVLLMYKLIKNPKSLIYKLLYILGGIGISLTFSGGGQLVFIFVMAIILIISIFKKQISNILTVLLTIIIMFCIPGTTLSIQSGLDYVYDKIGLSEKFRVDITFIDEYTNKVIDIFKSETNNEKKSSVNSNIGNDTEIGKSEDNKVDIIEPEENQSMEYRNHYKAIGIQLMKDYPILGIGIGNYTYLVNTQTFNQYMSDTTALNFTNHNIYPHNTYVQTCAEIGVIGLILLVITIFSYLFYVDFKNNKFLLFTAFMFVVAMLLAGYTEGVFTSKQYIFVFMIIYAFLCSKTKSIANNNQNKTMLSLFNKTYNDTKENYLSELEQNLKDNKKTFVVTANPEAFMLAEKKEEYMNMLLDDNTTIVPDGIGLVKAGRMLDYDIKERIPGIDIATKLLEYSDKYKKKVYLFGAKEEVIEKMKELMQEKYPNLKLVGARNGYEKDKDKVFQDIVKKEPDVILIALGMPMQEALIYKYYKDFKKGIFVGVGGSFDVMSGMKKRAPKIFQKLNLEWLYRIVKEPKRLKRFYDNNVKFIFHVRKLKRENN